MVSSGCFLSIFFFLASCATVDYIPPGQGISADLQLALAKSLEKDIKEIPFDPAGKTVNLHVRAFGSYKNAQGLEGYMKSLFQEWIVGKGGSVGPGGEFQIAVYLPALGDTATRRDLSYWGVPIFYSERIQASARIIVLVRDSEGRTVSVWQRGPEAESLDVYLMRIFGPLEVQPRGR